MVRLDRCDGSEGRARIAVFSQGHSNWLATPSVQTGCASRREGPLGRIQQFRFVHLRCRHPKPCAVEPIRVNRNPSFAHVRGEGIPMLGPEKGGAFGGDQRIFMEFTRADLSSATGLNAAPVCNPITSSKADDFPARYSFCCSDLAMFIFDLADCVLS